MRRIQIRQMTKIEQKIAKAIKAAPVEEYIIGNLVDQEAERRADIAVSAINILEGLRKKSIQPDSKLYDENGKELQAAYSANANKQRIALETNVKTLTDNLEKALKTNEQSDWDALEKSVKANSGGGSSKKDDSKAQSSEGKS